MADEKKADWLKAAQTEGPKKGESFTEKLDQKSLEYFSEICKKPFSDQAQFFLNAFWDEYGDQAECIYGVLWEVIKMADMRWRNIKYIHLYNEGCDLDFDMALYLFEQACKFFDEDKNEHWKKDYPKCVPEMLTSIVRKKEIREKVDVNFDGRVAFLEFLLYQFKASPKTLMDRSVRGENAAIALAKKALEEVNKKIREYETEKKRLEDIAANEKGVKQLKAINELAQLKASPLWEALQTALIKAEAALRLAQKGLGPRKEGQPRTDGTMWWLSRELKAKKDKYSPQVKDEKKS